MFIYSHLVSCGRRNVWTMSELPIAFREPQLISDANERSEEKEAEVEELGRRSRDGSDAEEDEHSEDRDPNGLPPDSPGRAQCRQKRQRQERGTGEAGTEQSLDPGAVNRRDRVVAERREHTAAADVQAPPEVRAFADQRLGRVPVDRAVVE